MNVLITGASNGIGEGLLKAYVDLGYEVYNFDIEEPRFQHQNAHYVYCNLENEEDIEKCFLRLPIIDILILNAATYDQEIFLKQTMADLKKVISVNLLSAIHLSKLYSQTDKRSKGRIILLASTRAYMSEKNTIGYSVSKGGLVSLTHSLAITLQDQQITVNAIAPGWINSSDEELREVDQAFHPAKRVGKIQDIVRTCMFLTDDDADFITGEVITVDGGVTKKMIYPEE